MSAIITDQIRILNAKNFVAGVSTSTNSYYAFVGLPNPTAYQSDWDSNPPAPVDNFDNMNDMNVDDTFDLISSCIDQVYSEEESWSHQDCTKKELSDFVESLNSSQFKMVENFFTSMPKLSHTVKVLNPNTNVESEIKIEGLQSFFG